MKKNPNKIIIGAIAAVVVVVLALALSGGSDNSGGSGGFGNKAQENTEVTIAQPVTLSDYSVREGENSIQDIAAYFGPDLFEYDCGYLSGYKLEGKGLEMIDAFNSYVDYVKANHPELTVLSESQHDYPYPGGGYNYYYSDIRFAYTGTEDIKPLTAESNDVLYLQLYLKSGKRDVIIQLSENYTFRDLGYRYDAPNVTVTPSGESADAGVIRKGNTFTTTDGRLSCELGNATILKSSGTLTGTIKYDKHLEENETFLVDDFNGDEAFAVKMPFGATEKCDVYIGYDMDNVTTSRKSFSTIFKPVSPELYYSRNGESHWEYPNPNDTIVKDATLRFMYYDGEVAVYYIYMDVDEPMELFGAVSLKQEEPEAQDNNSGSSGSSGSNGNSSWNDRNNNKVEFCSRCGNKGWYDCNDCIDGYNRVKITVPKATSGVGGTYYENIPCKSRGCNGGKIDCDRCDN